MTRLLAAILVLCTQVLAVFGTGNLVVCVHDDGESAIELVGSECCRAAHEAEQRQETPRDDVRGAVTAPLADRCTDVPYKHDQTTIVRGSQLRSETSHEVRTAPSAVAGWTIATTTFDVRVEHRCVRGPPREAVPRPARAFVLRC